MALGAARPFSAQERFQHLLGHGLQALEGGSYGIAACYVIRGNGIEVTLFGHNTLALNDPLGHAEMNALRAAVGIVRLPPERHAAGLGDLVQAGTARVRRVPPGDARTAVFSTLEPCPMCTVAIINAGVDEVTYAHDDELAGALAGERRARLGPLWARIARGQGLRVRRCQSRDPGDIETYLPNDLRETLIELFEGTRAPLDQRLVDRGFFHPQALVAAASSLTQEGTAAPAP